MNDFSNVVINYCGLTLLVRIEKQWTRERADDAEAESERQTFGQLIVLPLRNIYQTPLMLTYSLCAARTERRSEAAFPLRWFVGRANCAARRAQSAAKPRRRVRRSTIERRDRDDRAHLRKRNWRVFRVAPKRVRLRIARAADGWKSAAMQYHTRCNAPKSR